jgi:hypothetical protein
MTMETGRIKMTDQVSLGAGSSRKGVIRVGGVDCPPTAIANDGKTKLRRYEVRAVIYARNKPEAKRRLREADIYLDEAEVK